MNLQFLRDSLYNLVTSFGTAADKNTANRYGFALLDRAQVENAYRGDWIARKIIDIPPHDMTREWRAWQADKKDITAIEGEEKRLSLQMKVANAKSKARLYGGSALVMGVGADLPSVPLDMKKIKKGDFRFLHVVAPHEITPGQVDRNVLSEFYGQPNKYTVSPTQGTPVEIHPSRVIRLVGAELPDINAVAATSAGQQGWGDSVLQAIDDAVKNAALATGSIATMLNDCNIDVIKIPNMMEQMGSEEFRSDLLERVTLANKAKSIVNALLIDKEEEWQRITTTFTTLPDILKMYLLIASGAADIPATRMLGQSAVGMNSTGDGDIRNYYDRISADQRTVLANDLARLDEVLLWSTFGKRDEAIYYNWRPLWQMDEVQKATVAKSKAEVFQIDATMNLLDVDALKTGRENQLIEDGTYPGFEDAIKEAEDAAGNLNENDPEVKAGFEAIRPAAGTAGRVPAAAEVQKQALNGTQITSLQEIVVAVSEEQMPPETAKAILKVAFPTLDDPEINAIIDPMASFEPKPKEPPAVFGGAAPPSPGGEQPPGKKKPELKIVGNDGKEIVLNDATPRSLYVRRDVLNGAEIVRWAKQQRLEERFGAELLDADELHVTIVYSEAKVDWMVMGEDWGACSDDKGRITVPPGGPRTTELFGPPPGDTIAIEFSSSALQWRHMSMIEKGATHRWENYQPHISVCKVLSPKDVLSIEPYRGKIELGPEIFEEIKKKEE